MSIAGTGQKAAMAAGGPATETEAGASAAALPVMGGARLPFCLVLLFPSFASSGGCAVSSAAATP